MFNCKYERRGHRGSLYMKSSFWTVSSVAALNNFKIFLISYYTTVSLVNSYDILDFKTIKLKYRNSWFLSMPFQSITSIVIITMCKISWGLGSIWDNFFYISGEKLWSKFAVEEDIVSKMVRYFLNRASNSRETKMDKILFIKSI
jgi:hypothetical protein